MFGVNETAVVGLCDVGGTYVLSLLGLCLFERTWRRDRSVIFRGLAFIWQKKTIKRLFSTERPIQLKNKHISTNMHTQLVCQTLSRVHRSVQGSLFKHCRRLTRTWKAARGQWSVTYVHIAVDTVDYSFGRSTIDMTQQNRSQHACVCRRCWLP